MKLAQLVVAPWIVFIGVFSAADETRAHANDREILSVATRDVLLEAVIDAEIHATREYVSLLKTKAVLLEHLIKNEQTLLNSTFRTPEGRSSSKSWHRPSPKQSNECFDDWLAPQGSWRSPQAKRNALPPSLHVELISFRPNGNVGSKRNNPSSRGPNQQDPLASAVQFLMVIDKVNGFLELLHPTTQATLWQQRLRIPSQLERAYFHSDRASHLVLVTTNNDLLVYKMRVFHTRRLVAGDYRRHSGKESMVCNGVVNVPAGALDFPPGSCRGALPSPFRASWSQRTISPVGFHLHVEIEFDFATKSPRPLAQMIMVASHQALSIVTSSEDGYMGFYDGHNGTFLGEFDTLLGRVTHLQTLSSGIVALAVANRIHFVDAFDRRLLTLSCEGSRHLITSLERDVWRHAVLYAGTRDGKGLAFRINRFGSIKRNNGLMPIGADAVDPYDDSDLGFPTCKLTALLQPRARILDDAVAVKSARSAVVTTMPGHLLLATAEGHLVLYDTTSQPGIPAYVTEKSFASSLQNGSEIISVHAGKEPHGGATAVSLSIQHGFGNGSLQVELFLSRLTPVSSGIDIGWIRAPMMLFCAFGVMFWQQNRFRRTPSSLGDMDLPSTSRSRRQYGRSGISDWSRPTNHRAFSGR